MTEQRGPHNRGKCPFYVVPQNPLSTESSIHHCSNCAVDNNAQLRSFKEDLRQFAKKAKLFLVKRMLNS